MQDLVSCQQCGFLTLKNRENDTLCEASESFRRERSIVVGLQKRHIHEEIPLCFVQATSLREQCGGKDDKNTVLEVITSPRKCEQFIKWVQGFSPKEHVEMEMLRKERERVESATMADRRWRDDQAEKDRLWREQHAQREHVWRHEDLVQSRKWRIEDRSMAMSNIFVACFTGVSSVIVTLIAAKMLPWFSK